MTIMSLAGDVFLFSLGVVAGLSAPKIRAWFAGEVAKTKAEITADIERKL